MRAKVVVKQLCALSPSGGMAAATVEFDVEIVTDEGDVYTDTVLLSGKTMSDYVRELDLKSK